MGCGNSKPDEVAKPAVSAAPTEAQKEAQRKFREAQAKLEAEKADRKRQSLAAAQSGEIVKQQEALRKADDAEKEADAQAAAAIANQIAADLAEKQIEESRRAEEARKAEEQKRIMESFKGMGAKLRFRTALENDLLDEARDAAACMLQGAWRAKCARRVAALKRAEKQRFLEHGMARKIQSLYRCRQARRRAAAKRAEKKRILEEEEVRRAAAAIELAEKEAAYREQAEIAAAAAAAAHETALAIDLAEKEAAKEAEAAALAVGVADVKLMIAPAMKTGLIKKEGSMVKSMKIRHFVLRSMSQQSSRLTYFEGPKDSEPFGTDEKGSLEVTKATKITNVTSNMLTLVFPGGKNLKLEFLKDSDKVAWKKALEEHIAYCK